MSKTRNLKTQTKRHTSTKSSIFRPMLYSLLSVIALTGIVAGVWSLEAANAAKPKTYSYTITITETGFQPQTMESTLGSTVKIHLMNKGTKLHNFVLPAYYIFSQNLHAGESTDVEFTPDKPGSFPYYSDAPGSQEPGFKGQLVVR